MKIFFFWTTYPASGVSGPAIGKPCIFLQIAWKLLAKIYKILLQVSYFGQLKLLTLLEYYILSFKKMKIWLEEYQEPLTRTTYPTRIWWGKWSNLTNDIIIILILKQIISMFCGQMYLFNELIYKTKKWKWYKTLLFLLVNVWKYRNMGPLVLRAKKFALKFKIVSYLGQYLNLSTTVEP